MSNMQTKVAMDKKEVINQSRPPTTKKMVKWRKNTPTDSQHEKDPVSSSSYVQVGGVDELVEENGEFEADIDDEIFAPATGDQNLAYLRDVWPMFESTVNEEDLLGKFVGTIYIDTRGKANLFVAKISRRFIEDKAVHSMELDCLKPAVGRTTIL